MNESHKAQLRALSKNNMWGALCALVDTLVAQWQVQSGTGATEFEYLKSNLLRDGKIEGVKALLTSIENMNNV